MQSLGLVYHMKYIYNKTQNDKLQEVRMPVQDAVQEWFCWCIIICEEKKMKYCIC